MDTDRMKRKFQTPCREELKSLWSNVGTRNPKKGPNSLQWKKSWHQSRNSTIGQMDFNICRRWSSFWLCCTSAPRFQCFFFAFGLRITAPGQGYFSNQWTVYVVSMNCCVISAKVMNIQSKTTSFSEYSVRPDRTCWWINSFLSVPSCHLSNKRVLFCHLLLERITNITLNISFVNFCKRWDT